jgi:hypothetical protein
MSLTSVQATLAPPLENGSSPAETGSTSYCGPVKSCMNELR